MSNLIENIIPRQNFEIVGEKIGEILFLELQNQKNLQNFSDPINVFSERTIGFGNEDEIYINICLSSGSYSEKTQKDQQGLTVFNIDVFSNAKESEGKSGGENSAYRLQKFIGMIRYILSHTDYKTLGLPLGFIGGTSFESFEISEPDYKQDSSFFKMARILFSVRIWENQSMSKFSAFEGNSTSVKLDLTELGYKFNFKNQ